MKNLTLKEKYEAIEMVIVNKRKVVDVAKSFKCGKTQIYQALRNQQAIEKMVKKGKGIKKKKIRNSPFYELNKAVFEWFLDARAKNLPVRGTTLKEIALKFSKNMNIDFRASNGWLNSFIANHQMYFHTSTGESREVPANDFNTFTPSVKTKCGTYDTKTVASCGEAGLLYDLLPNKISKHKDEKCHNGKSFGNRKEPLIIEKSSTSNLRKKVKINNLTLKEKYEAIELVIKNKKKVVDVAKSFNCGITQIYGALKNKQNIENMVKKGKGVKKKNMRNTPFYELNKAVFDWYCNARANNLPVNGPILKKIALEFSKKMHLDFCASNGWLDSFKSNHQISFHKLSFEFREMPANILNIWTENIKTKIETYGMENIANCDKTELFFQLLPNQKINIHGKQCDGEIMWMDRITVLLTAFGDGTIIKPLVVGKSSNPRCFENLDTNRLPSQYKATSNACTTTDIFTEYLQELNQEMLLQNRKILLFLDNSLSPMKIEFSHVECIFFPPNSNSALQPLNVGIINYFKIYYRQLLLKKILASMSASTKSSSLLEKVNVLDSIIMVAEAAKKIRPNSIKMCFKMCGFPIEITGDSPDINYDMKELQNLIECVASDEDEITKAEDYVNIDQALATKKSVIDIKPSNSEEEEEDLKEMEVDPISVPTLADVFQSLDTLSSYSKMKGNNDMLQYIENIRFEINEDIITKTAI